LQRLLIKLSFGAGCRDENRNNKVSKLAKRVGTLCTPQMKETKRQKVAPSKQTLRSEEPSATNGAQQRAKEKVGNETTVTGKESR